MYYYYNTHKHQHKGVVVMSSLAHWCNTMQLLPVCIYLALVLRWSVIQWKAVWLSKCLIQFRYVTETFSLYSDIHVA